MGILKTLDKLKLQLILKFNQIRRFKLKRIKSKNAIVKLVR